MKQSTGVFELHVDPPGVALTHAIGVAFVPTTFAQAAPLATQPVVPVQPPKVTWQSSPQPWPHEFASDESVASKSFLGVIAPSCSDIVANATDNTKLDAVNHFIGIPLKKVGTVTETDVK